MSRTVKVDRQGRIVMPLRERERLDLLEGGQMALIATDEGILLERRRLADVATDDSGVPIVTISGGAVVSKETTLDTIHAHRDRR